MLQTTTAISSSGLVKKFGQTRALDGLDLSVRTGEVHGFLGPNGAGKTTTIRILLGLLRAGAGEARLLDSDPWKDAVALHRRLAYVPGDVALWPDLSGGEVIDLLGRLRGGLNPQRRASLLERFELDPRKKCGAYSKGNRQKVALVAALAAGVELLLLDEPTSGLDPLMEGVFRQVIAEDGRNGRTVLLSSHILAEVEALCDRVTIIRSGKAVESGSLADLRHLTRTAISAELAEPPSGLDELPGVFNLEVQGRRVRCELDTDQADPVLSTSVSRVRWAGSHLFVVAVGQLAVLAALGLASGLTYGLSSSNVFGELPRVLAAALAYLPPVWVMVGIAAAFFGLLPRFTAGSWAALVLVVFLELGWELRQIGQSLYNLSPFAHAPKILLGQSATWPFFGLIVLAAGLTFTGLAGLRRRDIR